MTDLSDFHEWLRSACPATDKELLYDLERGHKALPKTYAAFPSDAAQLSKAMRELESKGLVRRDLSAWKWCREREAVEPQMLMF